MSGPWEDYAPQGDASASSADSGPWNSYAPPPKPISTMTRIAKGMKDPIDGAAQLLDHALPASVVQAKNQLNNWIADKTGLVDRMPEGGIDQMLHQDEAAYQARRQASGQTGFDGARLAGNFVSPMNLLPAGRLGTAALPAKVAIGAARGAASGSLAPVVDDDNYWGAKAKQVALGGTIGGAIPAVGAAAARVISPLASLNPHLQLLKDEGILPTIGQAVGGRWNALEEKLQSVPILGDAIANARGTALRQFNKAAINRASGNVGAKVDDIGQTGVRQAGDAVSKAYDDALGGITGVRLDSQFNNDLTQLRGMAQGLTSEMRNKFNSTVDQVLMRKVSPTGSILPHDYKAIDSELGSIASKYGQSAIASEGELGDAASQLQSLLKQQMLRSNPQVAKKLGDADAGWANLVRVEGAAKSAKNAEGIFTPAQLNMAAQAADDSVRKRAVSRGTALLQDLGNAGQSVLGNKVPNSGTTDRALIAGGALGSYFVNPLIPAGLLGSAAMYLSPAQRALVNAVSSRPALAKPAADVFRQASPLLVAPGAQFGLGVFDQK